MRTKIVQSLMATLVALIPTYLYLLILCLSPATGFYLDFLKFIADLLISIQLILALFWLLYLVGIWKKF